MHKRVAFRNMDHSKALENYANEHLVKIEEFLTNEREPIYLDLVLEPAKVHAHNRIELRIKSPHYDVITHDEGNDMYRVLDKVVDTMLHVLREEKRKLVEDNKKGDWYKGA